MEIMTYSDKPEEVNGNTNGSMENSNSGEEQTEGAIIEKQSGLYCRT